MMRRRTLGSVAFLLLSASVGWGDQDGKMIGRIVDPSGAAVANASVVIYTWNQAPGSSFELREVGRFVTDNFGEFHGSFAAGTYEVFAVSRGLLPTAARVKLTAAATTTVSLKLQLDPLQPAAPCCDASVPTVPMD